MSTLNIRETLLQEVSILPADYCPDVLNFIETIKTNRGSADRWRQIDEKDPNDWTDEEREEWLRLNPPIPIEDDPTITPEHLARLRQREKDMDEGRTKVVTFTPEELEEFWQEIELSPEEAKAKARRRAHYRTPKQS